MILTKERKKLENIFISSKRRCMSELKTILIWDHIQLSD